jgi:hypothetical protein
MAIYGLSDGGIAIDAGLPQTWLFFVPALWQPSVLQSIEQYIPKYGTKTSQWDGATKR